MANYEMGNISKRAGRRAKRSEIWDSGIVVIHIWCTFDLVVSNVIWGVIRCTCLKMACNLKTTGHRIKRSEFGTQ